jgi:hypothetical protein
MKYKKQVHYVKGVFACPKCHQHFELRCQEPIARELAGKSFDDFS